jgi:hypothetical protein
MGARRGLGQWTGKQVRNSRLGTILDAIHFRTPNMLIGYLAIELMLIVGCLRRLGAMPTPTLYLVYLMLGHMVLWAIANQYLTYPFLQMWSSYSYVRNEELLHSWLFGIFVAVWAATIGIRSATRLDPTAIVRQFLIRESLLLAVTLMLWLRLLIVLPFMRLDAVFLNNVYMMMGSDDILSTSSSLIAFFHTLGRFSGIAAGLILGISLVRGRLLLFVLAAPLFAWHFGYDLAASSRYAFAEASALFIVIIFVGRGWTRFLGGTIAGSIAILSLLLALNSRNLGTYGFLALPAAFQFTNLSATATYAIGNLWEGIFVFSEHFAAQVDYEDVYKFQSFSPLPSFIDGFSGFRDGMEHRLHRYVPRGALDEVLQFGFPFFLTYWTVLLWCIRSNVKLLASGRSPAIAIILNVLLLLCLLLQLTYSLRTIFKIILFVLSASLLLLSRKRGNTAPTPGMVSEGPAGSRAR